MAFMVGQQVWIRCKVQPGPFSDERLVTIESVDGPISGFVRNEELKGDSVRGVVRSMGEKVIEVWIEGSFFTTNGLTNVSREMAIAA
jgi:hypothetical protein